MRGDFRSTVSVIRSGQPRPYADSLTETIIKFERISYIGPEEYLPYFVTEETARGIARHSLCGYTDKIATDEDCYWYQTRLISFSPEGETKTSATGELSASVWRFITKTPFTD